MKKIYSLLICIGILCCLSPFSLTAQQPPANTNINNEVEQIQIFPNPVNGNKLYITSKSGKSKQVSVITALGERIFFKVMTTNELDISSLPPGVYILRVKIGEKRFTNKLIRV